MNLKELVEYMTADGNFKPKEKPKEKPRKASIVFVSMGAIAAASKMKNASQKVQRGVRRASQLLLGKKGAKHGASTATVAAGS